MAEVPHNRGEWAVGFVALNRNVRCSMDKEFVIKGFKELGTGNRDYGRGIVRLHQSVAATIDLSRHGLVRIEQSREPEREVCNLPAA